jgi:hypothetical protein
MRQGLIAIALLSMLLQGCYYGHRESNTQQSNECYIMFVGDLNNVSVSIDEQEFAPIPGKADDPRAAQHKYRIKPGNHMILAERDGNLVLQKKIYIGQGETREVRIP